MTSLLSVTPTPAEVAATLPGDERLESDVTMDRAFTLDAPPAEVWPWVVQLGKRRAGWYFPRSVERLIPPGRRALWHVDPAYTGLATGDVIPDWGGKDATFTVASIEPPAPGRAGHLLYTSTRGRTSMTWSLNLTPVGADGTRFHLRLRIAPVKRTWLAEWGGGAIDLATIAGMAAGLSERLAQADQAVPQ